MQIIRHTNPNCVMADVGKKIYDKTAKEEDRYYFNISFIPSTMTDEQIREKFIEVNIEKEV